MALVVWKLGGSLLDLPDLGERIQQLKGDQFADVPVVIIPGGGVFADAVRQLDRTHQLDPRYSHFLALDAMQMTARFVANILGAATPVADPVDQEQRLQRWSKPDDYSATLEVWDVISEWNRSVPDLQIAYGEFPEDWNLTSDSIAAILAAYWQADRFVLCKSIDTPEGNNYQAWAEAGAVDLAFPAAARHLPSVEWVNLRAQ
ncbi:hypothetical protein DTL21_11210 [Bremerella cremea]|uniref:Aspartate/glutamate/uridylate kinase domain-containing protein n=1 Tax=Blastopirellula marina TaxID=124 RepID=A0A2S8FPJ3_9BACT|nr:MULTISPECIES: hypothetical protein [Pirellulaceae]PQO34105.1 hypothetical protein C5Y83_11205 [Blastopirellula marina]RCS46602.1 hypothetical protein DTL21_11210 [Bremerella cremea]